MIGITYANWVPPLWSASMSISNRLSRSMTSYVLFLWTFLCLVSHLPSLLSVFYTLAYVNISREGPLLAPHLPPPGFLDLEGEFSGLPCSPGMWVCDQITSLLCFETWPMLRATKWAALICAVIRIKYQNKVIISIKYTTFVFIITHLHGSSWLFFVFSKKCTKIVWCGLGGLVFHLTHNEQ